MSEFLEAATKNSLAISSVRSGCAAIRHSAIWRALGSFDRFIMASPGGSAILAWLSRDWHEQDAFNHSALGKMLCWLWAAERRLGEYSAGFVRCAIENSVAAGAVARIVGSLSHLLSGSLVASLIRGASGINCAYSPSMPGVMLMAFVFVMPFSPTSVNTVICVMLLLFWAGDRLYRADFSFRHARAYVPALLLLGAACVATISSSTVRGSIPALILWFSYMLVFFLASQMTKRDADLWVVALAWLGSATLVSLIGLLQYMSGIETTASWVDARVAESIRTRVYSVFDNPNMLAEYLSYAVTLSVAMLLAAKTYAQRLAYAAAGLICGACLVLTFSRGGWIAVALGAALVGLLRDRRLLLVLLAAALVSPLFFSTTVLQRASTIVTLDDSSAMYRLTIWKATYRMIADRWVTGVGLGIAPFAKVYPQYEIAGTPAMHTHNLYLQIMVEMGILGLLFFFWTMINHYRDALNANSNGSVNRSRGSYVLVGLVAATTGQLVHGFIDNIWYSPKNVLFFWLALGLAVGASLIAPKEAPDGL